MMLPDQAASLRQALGASHRTPSFAFIGAEHTGVSTLVTELAQALCYAGQRVLVMDCNPGHTQARRLYTTLSQAFSARILSLCDVLANPQPGLALLDLAASPMERARLSDLLWLRLHNEFTPLERDSAAILIDAPNPANDPVPASIADNIILVMTPAAKSITATYAQIKRLATEHGCQCFNVLINRAHDLDEAQGLFNRLCYATSAFLSVSLRWVGFVPQDSAVRRSQTIGKPLQNTYLACNAVTAFVQLAAVLLQWDRADGCPGNGFLDSLRRASQDGPLQHNGSW